MDKTYNIKQKVAKKQGFALLLTLSVLTVIIALTMVLLSYFNKVKEDADTTQALLQANIYYADILTQFKRFSNKKTLFNRLYRFPISLRTPDGRFSISIRCEAIAKGVNINWLGLEEDQSKQALYNEAMSMFELFSQEYRFEDADRLLEMLLLEIGQSGKFVKREQRRLRQKDGIISYEQFADIISRYQLEVDDPRVSRVPWDKYFSFSGKAQKIDAEYSSPELLALLFDIDIRTVREWYYAEEKVALKTFVEENNFGIYAQKSALLANGAFLGESYCAVSYGKGYKFSFKYIEGDAKNFEFYGK